MDLAGQAFGEFRAEVDGGGDFVIGEDAADKSAEFVFARDVAAGEN